MSTIFDTDAALAARLRRERESRGWSLADLAARSGVSRAMVSKIERGEASRPPRFWAGWRPPSA